MIVPPSSSYIIIGQMSNQLQITIHHPYGDDIRELTISPSIIAIVGGGGGPR